MPNPRTCIAEHVLSIELIGHSRACSANTQLDAMRLTPKYIRKLLPDQDSPQVERVDASQQSLVQASSC